jgi:xanthine dehydrogenase molybdenum-binding subunit
LDAAAGDLTQLAGQEFIGRYCYDKTNRLEDNDKVEEPITHLTFGFATQVVILDDEGALQKVVAAHDVGRVINKQLLEGQIEGSVHMGLGFALTEDLGVIDGVPTFVKLRQLGILRAKDMPEVDVIFIEAQEPEGPFGAKGVGEIGLVPTAGAVAGALHAFDGKRRYRLPMKDSAAAEKILGKRRKR